MGKLLLYGLAMMCERGQGLVQLRFGLAIWCERGQVQLMLG